MEDSFKPLQVGITNPTPTQQSGHVSPTFPSITITGDTSPPPISEDRRRSLPKSLPGPDTTGSQTSKQGTTIQNIQYAVPLVPGQSSSTVHDETGESISIFLLLISLRIFI